MNSRRLTRTAATTAALALGAALAPGLFTPASALPPGGAGTNTPGTSSTVSPGTVTACSTLSYTVSGFPANETVSVKFDNGIGYGDTSVQGSGVVSTAKADGSGTARGSVVVPCQMSSGEHTLRFLATEVVSGGTKGYTNQSPTFTVTGGSGSNGGSNSNSGGASAGGSSSSSGSSSTSGGGTIIRRTTTGGGAAAGGSSADGSAQVNNSLALGSESTDSADASTDAATSAAATTVPTTQTQVSATATTVPNKRAPWVGLGSAAAILIVGLAAISAYLYMAKKKLAAAAGYGDGSSDAVNSTSAEAGAGFDLPSEDSDNNPR